MIYGRGGIPDRRHKSAAYRAGYDRGYANGRRDALLEQSTDLTKGWRCINCGLVWAPQVECCPCNARNLKEG